MWDNTALLVLLVWPGVVVGCALLNMLISWTFSWSELVVDYLIGIIIGASFVAGTDVDASGLANFFLTASHGLVGLLKWLGADSLADPETMFKWSAGLMAGATVYSAALDHGSVAIGHDTGAPFFSILLLPVKLTFAIFTTIVGLLIMVVGMIARGAKDEADDNGDDWFAFIGGSLFFSWGNDGLHATTFGWVVNVFESTIADVMEHELYHSRQYIYQHDWLGVFYFTFGALWGLISSAIEGQSDGKSFDSSFAFRAEVDGGTEVGNPIEAAAYRLAP